MPLIAYRPEHLGATTEVRELRGHALGTWYPGEEREVPADTRIDVDVSYSAPDVIEPNASQMVSRSILDVLYSAGPAFVDAASGQNPLFTCSECGEHVDGDVYLDRATLEQHYLRVDKHDPASPRLCLRDYLVAHPDAIQHHKSAGASRALLADVKSRLAESVPQPAPEVPDPVPEPTPAAAPAAVAAPVPATAAPVAPTAPASESLPPNVVAEVNP